MGIKPLPYEFDKKEQPRFYFKLGIRKCFFRSLSDGWCPGGVYIEPVKVAKAGHRIKTTTFRAGHPRTSARLLSEVQAIGRSPTGCGKLFRAM